MKEQSMVTKHGFYIILNDITHNPMYSSSFLARGRRRSHTVPGSFFFRSLDLGHNLFKDQGRNLTYPQSEIHVHICI